MRTTAALFFAALGLFVGSAEAIYQQAADYSGSSCSGSPLAVLTVAAKGTCPAAVVKPCTTTATGSTQILCSTTADFTLGASGTYAVASIFPTESCANASDIMGAVAVSPGTCTSLNSIGFPIYGKADCTGTGSIKAYLDDKCTNAATGQDLVMDGTCKKFSIFGYQGSCTTGGSSGATTSAAAATTSAAGATTTTAASVTTTSKPASAGKVAGSLAGAVVAAVAAVVAF